jgi:hypothetical protein
MDIIAALLLAIGILVLVIVVLGLVGIVGLQLSWILEVWIDRIGDRGAGSDRQL